MSVNMDAPVVVDRSEQAGEYPREGDYVEALARAYVLLPGDEDEWKQPDDARYRACVQQRHQGGFALLVEGYSGRHQHQQGDDYQRNATVSENSGCLHCLKM